jgi:hypothetical protein
VNVHLVANLIAVLVVGILLGIIARTFRLLITAQWQQLDAFVKTVRNDDPAARRRFERITRLYSRLFDARVQVTPPPSPAAAQRRPAQGLGIELTLTEGSIRIERGKDDFKSYLILGLVVFQFALGLPATLVLFALVGLTVVFLVSLLISPLGVNVADPVILLTAIVASYLVVSRKARDE